MIITMHDWLLVFVLFFMAQLMSGVVIQLLNGFVVFCYRRLTSKTRQRKFGEDFDRRAAEVQARMDRSRRH